MLFSGLSRKTRTAAAIIRTRQNTNCLRHVLYPYGDDWHFLDPEGAAASVRISGNLVTNSGETLRTAALQGVGISLAAGFLIGADLQSSRLVRLLPDYQPVELAVNAVYHIAIICR